MLFQDEIVHYFLYKEALKIEILINNETYKNWIKLIVVVLEHKIALRTCPWLLKHSSSVGLWKIKQRGCTRYIHYYLNTKYTPISSYLLLSPTVYYHFLSSPTYYCYLLYSNVYYYFILSPISCYFLISILSIE